MSAALPPADALAALDALLPDIAAGAAALDHDGAFPAAEYFGGFQQFSGVVEPDHLTFIFDRQQCRRGIAVQYLG